MDNDVEVVPIIVQMLKDLFYLFIAGDIAGQCDVRIELGSHLLDPWLQFLVLIGKGQLGTFTFHGLGNTPGD